MCSFTFTSSRKISVSDFGACYWFDWTGSRFNQNWGVKLLLLSQAAEHLQSFIADCDRRTELAKKRLAETQDEISAEVAAKVTPLPCCPRWGCSAPTGLMSDSNVCSRLFSPPKGRARPRAQRGDRKDAGQSRAAGGRRERGRGPESPGECGEVSRLEERSRGQSLTELFICVDKPRDEWSNVGPHPDSCARFEAFILNQLHLSSPQCSCRRFTGTRCLPPPSSSKSCGSARCVLPIWAFMTTTGVWPITSGANCTSASSKSGRSLKSWGWAAQDRPEPQRRPGTHTRSDLCRKRLWRSRKKWGRGDERNAKRRRGSDSGRWSGSGNVKERENGRGNETERGSVGGEATLLCRGRGSLRSWRCFTSRSRSRSGERYRCVWNGRCQFTVDAASKKPARKPTEAWPVRQNLFPFVFSGTAAVHPPIAQDATIPLIPEKTAENGIESESGNIGTRRGTARTPTPIGIRGRGSVLTLTQCDTSLLKGAHRAAGADFSHLLQRQIISHPWKRALAIPGEMAWRQGRPQRLGGQGEQGEVSFHGQRQGQRSRALPVIRAGPTLQLRRARVWGDLSRPEVFETYP